MQVSTRFHQHLKAHQSVAVLQGACDCVVCRPGYPAEREVRAAVTALAANKLQVCNLCF